MVMIIEMIGTEWKNIPSSAEVMLDREGPATQRSKYLRCKNTNYRKLTTIE